MKINWLVRFRNKTFLASLLALVVAFIFDLLGLLGMLGVLIDPTTAGVGDSKQAMTYIEPKKE